MKNNSWHGKGLIKTIKTVVIPDPRGDYEVTDLTISIKRTIKGKEKITLVPIEGWGEMSACCKSFKEGDMVFIEGHFANKKWTNKEKVDISKNLIVLERIEKA